MLRRIPIASQKQSLTALAETVKRGMTDPRVVIAARQITMGCTARNDLCELQSIFDALKSGTSRVPGMRSGLRYVADPQVSDYFVEPGKLLDLCAQGACAEDCDSHAALMASLSGAIGFRVGLRAYGPTATGPYTHVYAVALLPKIPVDEFSRSAGSADKVIGLDTTVSQSRVGWEPPPGRVLTAWIPQENVPDVPSFRRRAR